jgi:cation diffusion facilitator family transporter
MPDMTPPGAHAAERRTWWVVGLTALMMVGEVAAGYWFNSMALLADGWHMASHAGALGIAAFAYAYARRHRTDPRFSYGTGKVGVLGGYTNAIVLAGVAVLMVVASVERLLEPSPIRFDEALLVATLGLVVNLVSAWVLMGAEGGHGHGGHAHGAHARASHPHGAHAGHEHEHEHEHEHDSAPPSPELEHTDHNLRAAYLHVVTDALTSVLAIAALLAGKTLGWLWLDPVMGLVGAVVILNWSRGLLRDTAHILLDGQEVPAYVNGVRATLERDGRGRVTDLHLWRLSPQHLGAVVSLVSHEPRPAQHYKDQLAHIPGLAHVTVEVSPCRCATGGECDIGDVRSDLR